MRYRPFGKSGMALSTIGLRVSEAVAKKGGNPLDKLLTAALENGINSYTFETTDLKGLQQAAESLSCVERRILFIGISASDPNDGAAGHYGVEAIKNRLKPVIRESGFQWIDLITFDDPDAMSPDESSFLFLESLRRSRMLRWVGARNCRNLSDVIVSRRYQVVEAAFDIDSNWETRRLIDAAVARDIAVFGRDYFPQIYGKASDVIPPEAKGGFFGLGRARNPLGGAGTYAFLHQTKGWTAEQLCLGYALAQPALSCIYIEPENADHLYDLAEVTERVLPASVPAQIEMARFNDEAPPRRKA